jgi:hypothetical protein
VIRKALPALGIALILVFLAPFWQGCGLDPPPKPPIPVPEPPFPPESPQDVIDNMEYAYNQMEYDRYFELIHLDFTFVFNEDDVKNFPDDIPASGVWGQPEEVLSAEHMLDQNFVPEDAPELAIDNLQLDLLFSGDPVLSNLQGVPEGTMEGYVTFDLLVTTVGDIDYSVKSRPLFYFVPGEDEVDGKTITRWWIWSIEDAPFGQPTLTVEVPKK